MNDATGSATVDEALRFGGGLATEERDHVLRVLGALDARLRSYRPGSVELELTIKERDTPSQRTTLEAWISGRPRLVSTSSHTDATLALAEVRDDLIRQITDAKNRTEPRNNRALRRTEP
jgi:ribosome-associated translation inhibitor RaiA